MLSNETRSSYFSPRRSESLYFFSDIYMYSLSALSTVTNEERVCVCAEGAARRDPSYVICFSSHTRAPWPRLLGERRIRLCVCVYTSDSRLFTRCCCNAQRRVSVSVRGQDCRPNRNGQDTRPVDANCRPIGGRVFYPATTMARAPKEDGNPEMRAPLCMGTMRDGEEASSYSFLW